MLDYLIVGQGVAGSCFALKLLREEKSFFVIDEDKNKASTIAVGIYNPVVLKRFSLIWRAGEQLELMHRYFSEFEDLLNGKFVEPLPTYRILKNEDEVKTWQKKSAMAELEPFLSNEIRFAQIDKIKAPLGYGEVKQTGRIDLGNCLSVFKNYLIEKELYQNEKLDYAELMIDKNKITYKGISAKRIVFCEGFGVTKNPYFNYLPVIGVKGEVLKIRTESEIPKAIWKAHNFLMPLDGKTALTASTYDRDDLTTVPTQKGKKEMQGYLEEIYKGKYEIIEHRAGIRPTIVDRRPVVGNHPKFLNLFILNGMGTRGTLLAPQMTEFLYDFIEKSMDFDNEANLRRFDKFLK